MHINTNTTANSETERETLVREIREIFSLLSREEKLRYLSMLREMLEEEAAD